MAESKGTRTARFAIWIPEICSFEHGCEDRFMRRNAAFLEWDSGRTALGFMRLHRIAALGRFKFFIEATRRAILCRSL